MPGFHLSPNFGMTSSLSFAVCWKDPGLPGEAMVALHPLGFLCSTPCCFQEYFKVVQLIPVAVCQAPHPSRKDALAVPVEGFLLDPSKEGEAGCGSDMTETCKADEAVPSCPGRLQKKKKNPCPKCDPKLKRGLPHPQKTCIA